MDGNLFETLRARFPAERSKGFIETEGRTVSYGELEMETGRMARLLAELGVAKGDRVAAIVEKSPEAIFLYLAALRAGATHLPLNTAYQAGELAYFLGDARTAEARSRSGAGASTRISPPSPRPATTWPPCSTPRAPPGAPRAP
jgi:malonyl-CoA/methylmalonyl-CoA synthetase